ncbi:MAG: M3 family metallopeptidase [Prevotella sp.]|jgi:peptidyl-dipeptidase Dcp|nr:M3 family metallopeptidase [Prevotella sp.]MCH4185396.1 M3 family metallopeptidase [Prevotella sp.]MCH4250937.1 M3 family metallopeptidase [Prevotella sp.]MCI1291891.1 M3 family metallopeptidase [Prevotella sp.]MCI1324653.1 M3 family metallopeptidase [Prevotella sp.]MCI1416275.1 M3 family metallopeptidase [Prevotella sp.]
MTKDEIEKQKHQNPFFVPYGTPHLTVPFDRILPKDYEEGILEGIRRENEEVDRIVNNPDTPTFDNTLDWEDKSKGDHYYDLLDRVTSVFSCMLSAETSGQLESLAQKLSPALTRHSNDISLNQKLFERVRYVHDHHGTLTPEENMLLDKSYEGFVRSGALLDEEGKTHLRKLTEENDLLTLQFSQNLLKENKAFTLDITDPADLDGLPQSLLDAAEHTEQGKKTWTFTLDYPSYSPFMTYSTRRNLREKMYRAKNTVCTHKNKENNIEICRLIVNQRLQIAQLLGYSTYADYVLKERMAGDTKTVYKLFNDLITAYKPSALKEVEEVNSIALQKEGPGFKMEPWDFSYYSHQLQMQRYHLDAEMLRPYFELSKVIKGVFGLATRLYGITFQYDPNIPVYHPDVKAYEVYDQDGSYLAVLYTDFHPRKGKKEGAWMTEFQGQWIEKDGKNIRPQVSLVMNLTKPTAGKPALLTWGEVQTFLHEFGHALHGMFANTRFSSLSGTNVWWDFVELPSQLMENFASEKDFLRTFAFHYQTGEPIPDELIDRIIKSRNFLVAYSCMRQVSFGLLDMAYYTRTKPLEGDLVDFEQKAQAPVHLLPSLPESCMTVQFSHIMSGGYAASYYSYKWAEVLDADAFSVFKKNGIFDRTTAQRFRDCILSKGGTEHPMTLYKRFRGQEPTIGALLKRDGIRRQEESLRIMEK